MTTPYLEIIILLMLISYLSIRYIFVIREIPQDKVGVLIRRGIYSTKTQKIFGISLSKNENGIVPKVLVPGMKVFLFPRWRYKLNLHPITYIPEDEIAIVVANYGIQNKFNNILRLSVDCNNFQDADSFFINEGQIGIQCDILTCGKYYINLEIFSVITNENVDNYDFLSKNSLKTIKIESGKIGIVTTFWGESLPITEIAGPIISGHSNFQNASKFINNGGFRGVQLETLTSGTWAINPMFASVEVRDFLSVPNDHVAVLISNIGNTFNTKVIDSHDTQPISKEILFKGIIKTPLYGGMRHAINTAVYDIVLVPTHQIIIEWNDLEKPKSNIDYNLKSIKVYTKDKFEIKISLSQVIRITPEGAPQMIEQTGTEYNVLNNVKYAPVQLFVYRVLSAMTQSIIMNIAAHNDAIDFISEERSHIQSYMQIHLSESLQPFGVILVGVNFRVEEMPESVSNIIYLRREMETKKMQYDIQTSEIKNFEKINLMKEIEIEALKLETKKIDLKFEVHSKQIEFEINKIQTLSEANKIKSIIEAHGGIHSYLQKLRIDSISNLQLPQINITNNFSNNIYSLPSLWRIDNIEKSILKDLKKESLTELNLGFFNIFEFIFLILNNEINNKEILGDIIRHLLLSNKDSFNSDDFIIFFKNLGISPIIDQNIVLNQVEAPHQSEHINMPSHIIKALLQQSLDELDNKNYQQVINNLLFIAESAFLGTIKNEVVDLAAKYKFLDIHLKNDSIDVQYGKNQLSKVIDSLKLILIKLQENDFSNLNTLKDVEIKVEGNDEFKAIIESWLNEIINHN